MKRTIAKELSRYRVKKVREMIERQDYTMAEIAKATGFLSPNHLYRLYKKHFGCPPRSERQAESRAGG